MCRYHWANPANPPRKKRQMNCVDPSPPLIPSHDQQRDALRKGLGRAVLWAKSGRWNDEGALLEACLNDMRYDRQCESPRGIWLWEIVEAVGAVDTFREPILASTMTIVDGFAVRQLCQFCVFYARQGDERFRTRLRDIVADKPVSDSPWLGEAELIELDREAGFLFAAELRGRSLSNREWDWDDLSIINDATETLGEQTIISILNRESETSIDIDRFRTHWQSATAMKAGVVRSFADRKSKLSLDEIIQEAGDRLRDRAFVFRRWGMDASDADLRVALYRLFCQSDPDILVNFLWIFSNRAMTQFDERVLILLDHSDERVRERAYMAVSQNAHPAIRKFAIDNIRQQIALPGFLELFVRNYQSGDEDLLNANLTLPDNSDECHGIISDLIKILEQNPSANCAELALRSYLATPCEICRYHAAKLLFGQKVAPMWLVDECRWDANSDIRELVELMGCFSSADS